MQVVSPGEAKAQSLTVFLCHSSTDKAKVRQIYFRLESIDGINPWLDSEALLPGADWKYEITRVIGAADVIIVCLSKNSLTKEGFVQREITHALDLADEKPEGTIFLIPLKIEPCDVPTRLARWQYVDYFEDDGFDRLRRSLAARAKHLGVAIQPTASSRATTSPDGPRAEIAQTLIAAHNEYLPVRNKALLETALRLADLWGRSGGGYEAAILKAQAFSELAFSEKLPPHRVKRWNSALSTLDQAWQSSALPELATEYAYLAIDRFQDKLSNLEQADRLKYLRIAHQRVGDSLRNRPDPQQTSLLLAAKSSILRHLSLAEVPRSDAQYRRLSEAYRCAHLAVDKAEEPPSRLELAESEWALSFREKTDEAYKFRLEQAELSYRAPSLFRFELARFALPKFYRMTFRPLDSCNHFPLKAAGLKNPRRRLGGAYLYAEAAIQLWYNDYVPETVEWHLNEARLLLETAVASGFCNARTILALAFVQAILDGPEEGNRVLTALRSGSKKIWTELLRVTNDEDPDHLIDLGFVLGMNHSSVWTSLGTYAARFLQDIELAEVFYRSAVRIAPYNVVALTNLARVLVRKRDQESLIQARALLSTAQQFSDRRFRWWRAVEKELESVMPPAAPSPMGSLKAHPRPATPARFAKNFNGIRTRFRQIQQDTDPQKRGYELEGLVFEIARLTLDTAAPSYRFQRGMVGITQVDAYFEHHGEKYRVECKWKQEQVIPDDVVSLADKMDVVGVSGVLISMSGFSDAAVERAKELRKEKAMLLIDGDEIRGVVDSLVNFDQLIRKKRLYLDQRSEPYHRVVADPEME